MYTILGMILTLISDGLPHINYFSVYVRVPKQEDDLWIRMAVYMAVVYGNSL